MNGDRAYALLIDFEIPNEVKLTTDDLPMSLTQEQIGIDDVSDFTNQMITSSGRKFIEQKSLVASHKSKTYYLISLNLLRVFTDLGLIVKKTHRIFSFKQETVFKDYIEKNIELRKNAKSKFEKDLFKLFNNSIFGKTLYNARKNDVCTTLVTNEKRFDELSSNPRLKECYPISENKLIMKLSANKIELKYPLYVGFFILELSKAYMYRLYYQDLKETFGNDVSLVYMDTDSFLLEFKNVDLHHEMKNGRLKHLMDLSNFPQEHDLYDDSRKGQLGLLKSETGCLAIKEAICLAPKAYSILLEDSSTKNTAKGVNYNQKTQLRHDTYRQVHEGIMKNATATCNNIRSFNNDLYTVTTEKVALAKIERKRHWVDSETSLAYGHPDIPVRQAVTVDSRPAQSQKRKHLTENGNEYEMNLNHKRLKPAMNMFEVIQID